MIALTISQQKRVLAVLVASILALVAYRQATQEPPLNRPLTFPPGMKADSPVRRGIVASSAASDPLNLFLERHAEKYPGVARDIFQMRDHAPAKPLVTKPAATVVAPPPAVQQKSPEEIAADLARADLAKFRFLGYLTDKDSSLFLSKEGELFIVKSGDNVLRTYQIKAVGNDHVVLYDTATKVEARIELSGSGGK